MNRNDTIASLAVNSWINGGRILGFGQVYLESSKDKAGLRFANLTGTKLTGARLTDADLRWANLTGANLRWADLTGCDLTGADLTEADLFRAEITLGNRTFPLTEETER